MWCPRKDIVFCVCVCVFKGIKAKTMVIYAENYQMQKPWIQMRPFRKLEFSKHKTSEDGALKEF